MATIDLRSSFLKGSASWQPDGHNRFISTRPPIFFISISSLLLIPLHMGHSESSPTLCQRRRRAHLSGLICFFVVSGWGGREGLVSRLGRGFLFLFFWNRRLSKRGSLTTSLQFQPRDNELLDFVLFDLMRGKKSQMMMMMIGRRPLATNPMDRTGDFMFCFCFLFFFKCLFVYILPSFPPSSLYNFQ